MDQTTTQRRRVTIKDVAELAGVTPAMVSFTLSGKRKASPKTFEAVTRAARELDYVPNAHAQRLVSGRCAQTIGLFALNLYVGIGMQKVLTVQRILQEQGFYVPLHAYGFAGAEKVETQVTMVQELVRQMPGAIVSSVGGLKPEAMEALRRYQQEGGMLVTFDIANDLECDQVVFERGGPQLAAEHLVSLGHRKIGFCLHSPLKTPGARSSIEQFQSAIESTGLQFRQDWVFRGGNHEEGGVRLAQWWLQLPNDDRPTALFIVNDQSAAAFTTQVQRAGLRVPEDVSIVGHDNALIAAYAPVPLTTVTHPAEAIGEGAAQLVLSRFQGHYDGPPRRIHIPSELVCRESTAPPSV